MNATNTTSKNNKAPLRNSAAFMVKLKPQLARALPAHMNADRMARLALTALARRPRCNQCSMNSIARGNYDSAQLGLEPGINGQGYLHSVKDTCTFVLVGKV